MPKLPTLPTGGGISMGAGGADLSGMESGTIAAAKEQQALGGEIAKLGFEYAVRQKKQEDDDFVFQQRAKFSIDAANNLEDLKQQFPDGKGIQQAHQEFLNRQFEEIQTQAPSETARKTFELHSQLDLDQSAFTAKKYERDQVSLSSAIKTLDVFEGMEKNQVQTGDISKFDEFSNAADNRINEGIANQEWSPEHILKLQEKKKGLAFATAQGLLYKQKDADSPGAKQAIMNHTFDLMDMSGKKKTPDTGKLKDMTSEQINQIRTAMLAEMESSKAKTKTAAKLFGNGLEAHYDDMRDPNAVKNDLATYEGMRKASGDLPEDIALDIAAMRKKESLAGMAQNNTILSDPNIMNLVTKRNAEIDEQVMKEMGIKSMSPAVFSAKSSINVESDVTRMQKNFSKMNHEDFPNLATGLDRNLALSQANLFEKDPASGMVKINIQNTSKFMDDMESFAQSMNSRDQNRLPTPVIHSMADALNASPAQATALIRSMDGLKQWQKTSIMLQLSQAESKGGANIDPGFSAAMLIPNERGSEAVIANLIDAKKEDGLRSRIGKALTANGFSESKITTQILNDPDIKNYMDALPSEYMRGAVMDAAYLETGKRLLAHKDNVEAVKGMKEQFGIVEGLPNVADLTDVNDSQTKLWLGARGILPAQKQNAESVFKAMMSKESINFYGFKQPEYDRQARIKFYKDSGIPQVALTPKELADTKNINSLIKDQAHIEKFVDDEWNRTLINNVTMVLDPNDGKYYAELKQGMSSTRIAAKDGRAVGITLESALSGNAPTPELTEIARKSRRTIIERFSEAIR